MAPDICGISLWSERSWEMVDFPEQAVLTSPDWDASEKKRRDLWPFWICCLKTQDMNTRTQTLKRVASTCAHTHSYGHVQRIWGREIWQVRVTQLCEVCAFGHEPPLNYRYNKTNSHHMFISHVMCSCISNVVSLFFQSQRRFVTTTANVWQHSKTLNPETL